MKTVRLGNFRCFQSEHSVPLAPLTLLVGENSTGKTSFLALIHALNGIMREGSLSSSWGSPPFNFGNFSQIVFEGGLGKNESSVDSGMSMGFDLEIPGRGNLQIDFITDSIDSAAAPVFAQMKFGDITATIDTTTVEELAYEVSLEIHQEDDKVEFLFGMPQILRWQPTYMTLVALTSLLNGNDQGRPDMHRVSGEDRKQFENFQRAILSLKSFDSFAGAPTRSKPQRTYDLIPSSRDAEGAHVMVNIAELSRNNREAWGSLQQALGNFGRLTGLFDEIIIKNYGDGPDNPFQIHVREYKKDGRGKTQNLIDVGYGVNQILPVMAELFLQVDPVMFLLQQPEVHLHPTAQAALGTLFCDFASWDKQLIVETHSDHLIDRVRMEVRDGKTKLTKDDVLLLFFERNESGVKIHPIRFDEEGNVVGAPVTYRRFFLDEVKRSIGW